MLIWSQTAFVSAMALSLLHSLWQGAVVGMAAFVLNARLKRAAPDVRCGAFFLLLLILFVVWLDTFCGLYGGQTRLTVLATGVPTRPPHPRLLLLTPADTGGIAALPDLSGLPLPASVFPALVAGWALGVCALSLRHIGGLLLLHRLSRTGTAPCPPAWEECAARLAARMGVRRPIRLRCSTRIDVPFAFGLFKSSILLPFSVLTGLAPEQAEALIAHELAHFARHDVLLNLTQVCMETVLFYHPVVRWLSIQIRAAREQHCDPGGPGHRRPRALCPRALLPGRSAGIHPTPGPRGQRRHFRHDEHSPSPTHPACAGRLHPRAARPLGQRHPGARRSGSRSGGLPAGPCLLPPAGKSGSAPSSTGGGTGLGLEPEHDEAPIRHRRRQDRTHRHRPGRPTPCSESTARKGTSAT